MGTKRSKNKNKTKIVSPLLISILLRKIWMRGVLNNMQMNPSVHMG